jgi:hypothetical protein
MTKLQSLGKPSIPNSEARHKKTWWWLALRFQILDVLLPPMLL